MSYAAKDLQQFKSLINAADHVVVLQAEHVDNDSLGSALGLENLLTDLGKQVTLYSADEVPAYLKHVSGWDRVISDLPAKFDLSILVDSATTQQLDKTLSQHRGALSKRPFIIIDHHGSATGSIDFATLRLIDNRAGASSQQIVELAEHFKWHFDSEAAYALAAGIKADTVNLSTINTTGATMRAMATLVDSGVDLERLRLNIEANSALPQGQVALRSLALKRARFFVKGKVAITYFTQAEYESLGDNPLVVEKVKHDLRTVQGVALSITITERGEYANASMRANLPVARSVAEHFGGGGHDKAASCRFTKTATADIIKLMVPVAQKALAKAKA